jgi:predicted component of type VI protein secretion system
MPVTVKIFTKASGRPTLYASRDFDSLPVSLGRDAACSIALADPHKHISRFHVELEEQDGTYWMTVVSKVNPVMVKGRRYGPGTRLTLHSGDTFEMGEFEVQVLLPEPSRAAAAPPAAARIISPASDDPLMQVLSPEVPAPEAGLFDEPTFVGGNEPTYVGPRLQAETEAKRVPAAEPKPAPASAGASSRDILQAFLAGAGLPRKDLSPAESERMMRDCGAILRASVEGLMMLLIARGEMRKEFQAEDRTMVAARDNNPLKLMSDPHEAMAFLFDPTDRTDGFLDPVQAIGDACEDLRAHELALMAGMRAAIVGALRRLDPHALERAFEKSSGGFSLGSRKAKLWELFVAQQEKLAHEAQEDFNKVFGRDFMGAYQAQLRRLKGGR